MRRSAFIAGTVVLVLVGLIALVTFFSGRDDSTIGGEPGVAAPRETAQVLERGNIVLDYGDAAQAGDLRSLAQDLGASADPALVDAGAAVVIRRADGVQGVVARAWKRRLEASGPDDPGLRPFVEYWLGRGADDGSG